MSSSLVRLITRSAYAATQLPRVAWYVGHGLAMRRLSERARQSTGQTTRPQAHTNLPVPDRSRLYVDMAGLLRRDLANVEAGIYPLPTDLDGSLLTLLDRSRRFFEDLPEIHRRRNRGAFRELAGEETRGKRPAYYLQNFHFQSKRLDDGRFGKAIRYAGRGIVQRDCKCNATAGAPAVA
jgi:hypothetical protein